MGLLGALIYESINMQMQRSADSICAGAVFGESLWSRVQNLAARPDLLTHGLVMYSQMKSVHHCLWKVRGQVWYLGAVSGTDQHGSLYGLTDVSEPKRRKQNESQQFWVVRLGVGC